MNSELSTLNAEDIEEDGIDVTAVTKLKHADLYAAAKSVGSQSALAKHLGISAQELGRWCNLKGCPPNEPTKIWTEE